MDLLWAPWRTKYIQSFKDKENIKSNTCFLCDSIKNKEEFHEKLIVAKSSHCFVILNKFPYNGGHLLIAPYRHTGDILDILDEEIIDMNNLTKISIKILNELSNPLGYNIGYNIGRVAGAGLPEHLHLHVIPRWNGDTSFISIISDTKVISQALEETQVILSEKFKEFGKY